MTLAAPYLSTAQPDEVWYATTTAYLNLAWACGIHVHFALNAFESLPIPSASLPTSPPVNRFKSHPAVLAWYLADEPDGGHIKPSLLQVKYDLLQKLDPSRPASMVFNLGGSPTAPNASYLMSAPYLASLDGGW